MLFGRVLLHLKIDRHVVSSLTPPVPTTEYCRCILCLGLQHCQFSLEQALHESRWKDAGALPHAKLQAARLLGCFWVGSSPLTVRPTHRRRGRSAQPRASYEVLL